MDNFRGMMEKSLKQQEVMIKLRQEYNLKILGILKEEVLSHPEIRLCQLLSIFKIGDIDKFNEESVKTYNDIVKLKKERERENGLRNRE